jgi:uncharacterized damage-inducible protein DinB
MRPKLRVVNNCIVLLKQAISLLDRLDDEVYLSHASLSPRGTIGAHLRHILDFYQSFFTGLQSGRVNYNLRRRDALVESNRVCAIKEISKTIAALQAATTYDEWHALMVCTEQMDEALPAWCPSTFLRELDFLQSHTVHHFAVVAMLLRLHEVDPGEEFGVAPSTLSHWRKEATCAP